MNKNDLERWAFEHGAPDKWWVIVDGGEPEGPIPLDSIVSLGAYGDQLQVLNEMHRSKEDAMWVTLTRNVSAHAHLKSNPGIAENYKPKFSGLQIVLAVALILQVFVAVLIFVSAKSILHEIFGSLIALSAGFTFLAWILVEVGREIAVQIMKHQDALLAHR